MLFKRVYLEIGNICNLKCPFCSPLNRLPRQMNESEFRSAAEQLRPYTDFLYFHIKGEPLCHPLLERFLEIADELDYQVNLTTNATLLEAKSEMLLRSHALRQMNLSLHSSVSGDRSADDHYLDAAIDFAKKAAAEGKYIVMRFWNLDENRTAPGGDMIILRKLQEAFPGHDTLLDQMTTHRSVCLDRGIFVSFEEEFEWPDLEMPFLSATGFCHGLRQMIGVLCDGTVVPCCLDGNGEAPLGNLFVQPLSEILESRLFTDARNSMYNRKLLLPLCQRCSYRTRFDRKSLPSDVKSR